MPTLTQPVALERDRPEPARLYRCAVRGCTFEGTDLDFGFRKDGRRNTACAPCRAKHAAAAGHAYHSRVKEPPRDIKALRVVERWAGFKYKAWLSDDAKRKQYALGVTFQELWTEMMRRLAARAERYAHIRNARETARLAALDAAAAATTSTATRRTA